MKSKSIQKEINWKEKFIELVGQNIAVAINDETHLPNTSFEWVGKAVNTISPKIDIDKLTLFIGDLLLEERQRTLEEVVEGIDEEVNYADMMLHSGHMDWRGIKAVLKTFRDKIISKLLKSQSE